MNNSGKITVFLSLIMVVMMPLVFSVVHYVSYKCAVIKATDAVCISTGTVKAMYNRSVFDRYHILLIDRTCNGAGQGMLEIIMEDNLRKNLGGSFDVKNVKLLEVTGILDNDLSEFKKQIKECVRYELAEETINNIKGKVEGNDSPVAESDLAGMDSDIAQESSEQSTDNESTGDTKKDPRKSIKQMKKIGIAYLIAPESIRVSDYIVDKKSCPSYTHAALSTMNDIDTDFDSYDSLKKDLKSRNGWLAGLEGDTEAIYYATQVFGNALEPIGADSRLCCELEYLIGGKESDSKNFKKTVDEIIALRLAVNYSYLIHDMSKMKEVSTLAWELSFVTLVPQPILKYLLAGCWSYIEGIADTYYLLRGYNIPYRKNHSNWITDIDSLANLDGMKKLSKDDKGLNYKEYLVILLGMHKRSIYYRMLDLIEINTKINEPGFEIENCMTHFYINAEIEYGESTIFIGKKVGY